MFTKSSIKAIPLAAAMTAALIFGAAAHAQSGTVAPGQTYPPGTTNPKDSVNPAPTGGVAKSAEERTEAKVYKKSVKAGKRAAKKAGRKTKSDAGGAVGDSAPAPSK